MAAYPLIHDEALSAYLAAIGRFPLLSVDEELALGQRARAGDTTAGQRLVLCNLRLVVAIARRYHARELTFLDLIQEGTLGLIHAVAKYEPRSNARFATYARWWIRRAISEALMTRDRAIPLPEHIHYPQQRVRHIITQLSVQLGRMPTAEETAQAANIPLSLLQQLNALPPRQMASLDAPLSPPKSTVGNRTGEPLTLGQTLMDTEAAPVEEQAEQLIEQQRLYHLLRAHLEPRELAVIALRYRLGPCSTMREGRDNDKPLAHRYVAKHLGISEELVRLIEAKAFAKLRQAIELTPDGVISRRKLRGTARRHVSASTIRSRAV